MWFVSGFKCWMSWYFNDFCFFCLSGLRVNHNMSQDLFIKFLLLLFVVTF